ncbi:uncharacterized protein LOC117537788 isoform X1 [Gymnodraco acuticeps]|uniref:Uncharacterized protein LOC117537788 isoform X1 n=1 Tax=Gymnodraco acuticeps TaxID=8218 RepID=A0A6P8T5V3_GYMAC|nr:uncharacterized protein LOC117537788 isoform X1 [Gymnodraco acuticeps]XP_034059041.1 uncharacterized protein LOC117537788 isoform X1 [Gymnodraco acuticeps]XP_034059043.1 uncharacterized protein LOC117537788 isoform X1 [Gymnodraco acuticeps]
MDDLAVREFSFLPSINDINELSSDEEFVYGDMSFPQCSDNINELNDEEPTTSSQTNSSHPITLDSALECVLAYYQNSDTYPGLGLLNQLADGVSHLNGVNSIASTITEAPVSIVQNGEHVSDSESPVCSMQSGRHVDQNDTPKASESPPPSFQHGGGANRNATPSVLSRPVFNNTELRQSLVLPPPNNDEADFTSYYGVLMNNVQDMVNDAFSRADREDIVQVELRGEQLQANVSAILNANDDNLADFEEALFNAVQSNLEVMADSNLELVVQIVQSPRGGGAKRLAGKMLDNEIVKKKRRFLYVVQNPFNQLCFAINLALLLHDNLTDKEGFECGKYIQRMVGLTDQTAVTFNDIVKFKES